MANNGQVIVQINGLSELQAKMNKYPAISEAHVNKAISRSLVRILGQEKQQAPQGVTGNLYKNWSIDIGRFQGSLKSNAPYSMAVHNGTRPHYVPVVEGNDFYRWCQSKGLNPWAVAKTIAKKGTKGNPFLQRSVDMERENINREFKTALDGITKELSQI